MDFYMYLPSNASGNIYPDNKTADFKVQLAKRMELHGEWCMALVEVQYPNTLPGVFSDTNWVAMNLYDPATGKTDSFKRHLPTGKYQDQFDFLMVLSDAICPSRELLKKCELKNSAEKGDKRCKKEKQKLQQLSEGCGSVSVKDERIHIHAMTSWPESTFELSPHLALQLGLDSTGPFFFDEEHWGKTPLDLTLGQPAQMYIYMSIIEDQIVGDTRAPLVRTVTTDSNARFGTMTSYKCDPPLYFRVNTKSFDTVEVNIRTHSGSLMPFDCGSLTLLCHFKPLVR